MGLVKNLANFYAWLFSYYFPPVTIKMNKQRFRFFRYQVSKEKISISNILTHAYIKEVGTSTKNVTILLLFRCFFIIIINY